MAPAFSCASGSSTAPPRRSSGGQRPPPTLERVAKHAAPLPAWRKVAMISSVAVMLAGTGAVWLLRETAHARVRASAPRPAAPTSPSSSSATTPSTAPAAAPAVNGLLTFRGNATRTAYGKGPVPQHPSVLWSYPDGTMCSESHDLSGFANWCGTGWTGEPAVWEHDGRTLVAFGAYDRAVHVLDASTGDEAFPPFVTGDLIKGSVTVDPDGFPLLYTGSRDDYFRVLSY